MRSYDETWEIYARQKQSYEPEIERLRDEADSLARRFRQQYAAASEAYVDGRKAEAKVLSLEAKEIERECRRLNSVVHQMRQELRDLRDELKRQEAEEVARRQELEAEARRWARALHSAGRSPRNHSPNTSEPSRPHPSKAEPRKHVEIYHFDEDGEKITEPAKDFEPGTISHVTEDNAVSHGEFLNLVREYYADLFGGRT